jgi:hypothetical protein
MALQTGYGSMYGSNMIGSTLQIGGGAGEEDSGLYYRTHRDQYPSADRNVLAEMLLTLLLQITNPGMTTREELMIRGNRVAPGVSEENLTSPNVSPLAIRRVV